MTLEFKKESQITQPQSTFNIMEMCYEETLEQEEFGRSPDEIADARSRSGSISTR